jgi:hypothetical protein
MSGVSQDITKHNLNIKPDSKLVKQDLRRFNQEKRQAMGEELSRLLATGFIKEIQHPDWIANPVLVPKKNGKWSMCVNYTSLNKACRKDSFPLPLAKQRHIKLEIIGHSHMHHVHRGQGT